MNRSSLSSRPGPLNVFAAFLLVASMPFLQSVSANPSGPTIRHGDIQIVNGANSVQILQSTSHGIIDWNSFSIQNGQVTQFVQPGASSATLNRVTGQSLSRIDGSLLANGRVLLLNPNGVLIGRNGVVDTAGFTASTLDLSNENFLSGGDLRFQGNSTEGVVNLGSINAVDGDVFLIASSVLNEGTVSAPNGTVGLAAGNDVLIAESGSERVFVRGAGTATEDSGVINRGTVNANVAELKSYGGNIYGMAVKNEGRVAATSVTREGGQIFLRAGGGRVRNSGQLVAKKADDGGTVTVDAGASGETEIGGTIDASGASGTGGEIFILVSAINVFEDALIIADGDTGGGRILVGGGRRGQDPDFNNAADVTVAEGARLSASARVDGNGGELIIFAENRLNFFGSVASTGGAASGDGGFIELSGKNEIYVPDISSRVSLAAANGSAGTLLFDPRDVEIVTGPPIGTGEGFPAGLNQIAEDDIISFLETVGNLTIETSGTGGSGDITVLSGVDIEFNGDNTLSFVADRDFVLERGANIRAWEGGSVSVAAKRTAELGRANGVFAGGGIATNTGDITITGNIDGTTGGTFSGVTISQTTLATTNGLISIEGTGGNIDALAGESNIGVLVDASSITASGSGGITIKGTGGLASVGDGTGIAIGVGNTISAMGGDIQLTGFGGTGSSEATSGIQTVSAIQTTGLGSIELIGTGGASNGHGLDLGAAVTASGTGNVLLRGESQVSAKQGIRLSQSGAVVSTTGTNSSITLEANSIDLAFGGIQSPGDLVIAPLQSNTEINLGAGANDVGLQLDTEELALLSNGFKSITIGNGLLSGIVVNINAASFSDPLSVLTPNSGGQIFVNGTLSGMDDASISLDGSGPAGQGGTPTTTYLAANIVTEGNAITIDDDVVLKADVTLDTTNGGAEAAGAGIDLRGTVDSDTTSRSLSLDSGTGGDVTFGGAVGGGEDVNNVDVLGRNVVLSGSLNSLGSVGFGATDDISVSGGGILSEGNMTLTAGRSISVTGNTTTLESVSGSIDLAANSVLGTPRTGTFHGVNIGNGVVVETADGTIKITGVGGTGAGDRGVMLGTGTLVAATGEGAITITGNAGSGSGTQMEGVSLNGSTVTSTDGDLLITGTGGGDGSSTAVSANGIVLSGSTVSATGDGSVTLDGTAGDGGNSDGVLLSSSAIVETTGTGSIEINGLSGAASDSSGLTMSSSGDRIGGTNTSGAISLFVDSVDLAGGSIQSSGDFLISPIDPNSNINIGAGALDEGLQLDNNEVGRLADGFSSITIGDDEFGNGTFRIGAVTFSDPLSLFMPDFAGEFIVTGTLRGNDNASIFIDGSGPGTTATTYLSADIVTQGNTITISDNVVLQNKAGIDSTDGGLFASGADIDIEGTIEGAVSTSDLSIDSGRSGEILLRDQVGSGGQLGALSLKSRRLSLLNAVSVGGNLTVDTLNDILIGSGSPVTAGGNVVMDANRRAALASGDFSGIEVNSGISATGSVTLNGTGGGSAGNSGVVIESGGSVSGTNGISIIGSSDDESGRGILAKGNLSSTSGDVRLETEAGDIDLIGSISTGFPGTVSLVGSGSENTRFLISGDLNDFALDIDGGFGMNTVDFSGFNTYNVAISSDQLTNVSQLIGGSGEFDEFSGSFSRAGSFTVTDETTATYREGESKTIEISEFGYLVGSDFDDTFEIDAGAETTFAGELYGLGGDDRFEFVSGSVIGISGQGNETDDGDVIDYSALNEDILVDLENKTANRLDFFDGIETFIGGGGTNTMVGSSGDDEIAILGNGRGTVTLPGESFDTGGDYFGEGDFKIGGFNTRIISNIPPETFNFVDFDLVSGAGGDDTFSIEVAAGDSFSGTLQGDAGEDAFIISPGGGVARIEGGGDVDTLDFSRFSNPVSVNLDQTSGTQVGEFQSIESIVGGSGEDTLSGTRGTDNFIVTRDNGGFLNSGAFDSFEVLQGQGGTDRFTFQNQASVSRFVGGSGTDTFVLDDRNLTGTNTYTVTENSVTRNPTYLFSQIEFVQLLLGSGNDTVVTDDNGFVQIFNGGGGDDTIDFGSTPVSGRDPFLIGNGRVFESQFENFILVRDESTNPENINQQGAGLGGNQGPGSLVDQFTNTGGFAEALGNAFGAIAGNAIIAGQASVLQVEGGQVEAPLSLDGFFTQPPREVVGVLGESLEISAWTELANAIGFGGATILVNNDGPYSILLDGVPPNEILPVLLESLRADAGLELFEALELTIVIPITSDDGPVSIVAIPVQIEPAILQLLVDNLNNQAFSELTAALDD